METESEIENESKWRLLDHWWP